MLLPFPPSGGVAIGVEGEYEGKQGHFRLGRKRRVQKILIEKEAVLEQENARRTLWTLMTGSSSIKSEQKRGI